MGVKSVIRGRDRVGMNLKSQINGKKPRRLFLANFNKEYCISSTRKRHIFLLVSNSEKEIFMA